MATQKEIDDMLQDSWCASSTLNNDQQLSRHSIKKEDKYEISYDKFKQSKDQYGEQQFQDFEESRRTNNLRNSSSEIQASRKYQRKNVLVAIAQQPTSENKKQKLALTVTNKPNKEQKAAKTGLTGMDKLHLTHNYARIQQRQRQLLFTTLSEQNKQLKNQLHKKTTQLKNLQNKYKVILDQKTQEYIPAAKQQALQKKVAILQGKLQKINNLYKLETEKNKYKTKISKTPQNFIPEEQADRRESELLDIIDKLKSRIIQADENMKILQQKLNQNVEYSDELVSKMRRVQQVQYRIQKMTEQAETDRGYIQLLKEKVKEMERKYNEQKDKRLKLEIQVKRMDMGHETNSDIIQELKQMKKEKQLLEKSLKEMSLGFMKNVQSSGPEKPRSYQKIEDLQIG